MKMFPEGAAGGKCLHSNSIPVYPVVLSFTLCVFSACAQIQPLVAVHDSELTRGLETTPVSGATPSGPGTTGFQWWPTNWHYFVMPESLKETLRSDGTAFTVVSDTNISAGQLLDGSGRPRYPILISLASEAIANSEIGPLTNYVAAGGFLFVGSSSFTRNPDGTARGDFAIAPQMGISMSNASLVNWALNNTLTPVSNHRIVSHVPPGVLRWQMPSASEEISWPEKDHPSGPPTQLPHMLWQVKATGASVLAEADASPYVLVKPYGKGWFIYYAGIDPLLAHGSYGPAMYTYMMVRNAIEWAFQNARVPVPKLSPWPFPYDAAVTFRHDMEALPDLITSIEASAQYEANAGVRGDYFFCTGELREDMPNPNTVIAGLRTAIQSYGAMIQSHNGGLPNPNPYNPPLDSNSYDYWHWGIDEALDADPSYAMQSLSNSFSDIDGWFAGLNNGDGLRMWVAPYFNATRERSHQIQEQIGVVGAGDQKIGGPFPHWTMSTQTSGHFYSSLTLPVSDWYVGSEIGQSMEHHTTASMQALVDFYYNIGALVNLYCHSSSAGGGPAGNLPPQYIAYSLAKPRIWPINMAGVYEWWVHRKNAQITPTFTQSGNLSALTFSVSGATDPQTAVEVHLPDPVVFGLQVLTNGVLATGNAFRQNGQTLKILVGTSVSSVQVQYRLVPSTGNDSYTAVRGTPLNVGAPGVLGNDVPGVAGGSLTASLVSGPSKGTLSLNANGSFAYTPGNSSSGVDAFTYRANDGQTNSAVTTATIMIAPVTNVFFDDMSRPVNSPLAAPWTLQFGTWGITNGALSGSTGELSYGFACYSNDTWTDYTFQGTIQFSDSTAWGGGIGGRLNAITGAHYAAWIFPENSGADRGNLQLIKYEAWGIWSLIPMGEVSLPSIGTSPHILGVAFNGVNITVSYDGTPVVSVDDDDFDGVAPFTHGGICADFYQEPAGTAMSVDDVSVTPIGGPIVIQSAVPSNGNLIVTFTSQAGHVYREQYEDDLTSGNWIDVSPDVTATGLTSSVTNVMNGPGQRFYRIFKVQ